MGELVAAIIVIVVMVVLFVVFREAVTWYWKINHALDLLAKIEENTRGQAKGSEAKVDSLSAASSGGSKDAKSAVVCEQCSQCGRNREEGATVCGWCGAKFNK